MKLYTRAQANEILTMWKQGAKDFPPHIITICLFLTGDITGVIE